ncbi:unannotated protein [freshwater metagenome]|uniref:Unannotated protein n=1 Tax=freshwater metagenome TaxID=449393 RepID=A0A6J7PU20_9ZZZZ
MLGIVVVLIWADRRFKMGHGRVFALYVGLYCAGRLWIESLRIDTANLILGLRLNIWTALLVGIGALIYLVISARRRPGRESVEEVRTLAADPAIPASAPDDFGSASIVESDT